jgi:type III secretory pathway component EscU
MITMKEILTKYSIEIMKPGSSEFSPHDDKNMVFSEQIFVEFCKTVFR